MISFQEYREKEARLDEGKLLRASSVLAIASNAKSHSRKSQKMLKHAAELLTRKVDDDRDESIRQALSSIAQAQAESNKFVEALFTIAVTNAVLSDDLKHMLKSQSRRR